MGLLIFSGLISTLLAIRAYKVFNYRRSPYAKHFTVVMLCMALWSVNYAFEIGFLDIEYKYLFARLQYLGIGFTPVAWFLFAAEYSGVYRSFARKYEKLLYLFPCLAILLMITNNVHGLFFEGLNLGYSSEGFPLLIITHGPFFWIFISILLFYSYLESSSFSSNLSSLQHLMVPSRDSPYCCLCSSSW
jgi:hypothetical protein